MARLELLGKRIIAGTLLSGLLLGVTTIAGDGIIGIDDGDDAAELRELVQPQTARVAAAIRPLMVIESHIQRQRVQALAGFFQQSVADHRMPLDDLELLRGQPSGFVEDLRRDPHLADVVQQPAEPEQMQLLFVHAQVAAEGDREHTDVEAVFGGIFVLMLDLGHPEHGLRIGEDGLHAARHGFLGQLGIQHLTGMRRLQQGLDVDPARLQHPPRNPMFETHRLAGLVGRARTQHGSFGARLALHPRIGQQGSYVLFLGRRRKPGHIGFLGLALHALLEHIDVLAMVHQGADLTAAAHLEPLKEKRRLDPGAIEFRDEHADLHFGRGDLHQTLAGIRTLLGPELICHRRPFPSSMRRSDYISSAETALYTECGHRISRQPAPLQQPARQPRTRARTRGTTSASNQGLSANQRRLRGEGCTNGRRCASAIGQWRMRVASEPRSRPR